MRKRRSTVRSRHTVLSKQNPYDFIDPKDYAIDDVFYFVNDCLLTAGRQYLEKASNVLRLQSTLLLLNDDLPANPNLIMLLADQTDGDRLFKVSDEDSWKRFIAGLTKILTMDDASVVQRIAQVIPEKEELKAALAKLSDETELPFSEENCGYCSKKLGLDLNNRELVESDVYKQLVCFREVLDRLALLLNAREASFAKSGSDRSLTLFSSLVSCNLPAFRKLLEDGKESPVQSIGDQPLVFYTLDPVLVRNNLSFFISLSERLDEIPGSFCGVPIIDMLLRFDAKPHILKRAFNVCLSRNISLDYEYWKTLLDKDDWKKQKDNYRILAECQRDNSKSLLEKENGQEYIRFIESLISKGQEQADFASFFIDPTVREVLVDEDREQFLEVLRPVNNGVWSFGIFERLVSCGFLDEEIKEINLENLVLYFFELKDRWGDPVELDDDTPEIKGWIDSLRATSKDKTVVADVVCVLKDRKDSFDSWGRGVGDITSVLNIFAQNHFDECFLYFAKKTFESLERSGASGWRFSSPTNEIVSDIPFDYLKKLLKNEVIERLQLDDATISKHIPCMSLDDFCRLVNGNNAIGNQCLNAAAAAGKKEILEYLLDDLKIPVTGLKSRWRSENADVLVEAAQNGQIGILNYILSRSPKLRYLKDSEGLLPIHRAVDMYKSGGSKEKIVTERLNECISILCGGTDGQEPALQLVNAPSAKGTPLAIAAGRRNLDVCSYLLKIGADVNACPLSKEGAAVVQAARDESVVSLLLEHKSDVNFCNQQGQTLFNQFSFSPQNMKMWNNLVSLASPDIVAKFDKEGKTALHCLADDAERFEEPAERRLVSNLVGKLVNTYHIDINASSTTYSGGTPFTIAASNSDIFMMRTLMKYGAIPEKCNADGQNAVFCLVSSWRVKSEALKFLVEKLKLDVNARDDHGKTCLFEAMDKDKRQVFDYLVGHGADVHVRSNDGENLLWKALDEDNYGLFKDLIVKYKVDVSKSSNEGNILFKLVDRMRSTNKMSLDVFKELFALCLDHGARINDLNNNQVNIVAYAIEELRETQKSPKAVLEYLLSLPNLRCSKVDGNGNTWLHIASDSDEESAVEVAKFLIEEQGFEVSTPNDAGEWPIHLAAQNANLALCKVLYGLNPAGIRQPTNRGEQPLARLVSRKAENLYVIKKFIDDFDADIQAVDGDNDTLLDTYLDDRDSAVDGVVFFSEKGVRCTRLELFADKKADFFKAYVETAFHGNAAGLVEQLQRPVADPDEDVVVKIINSGNTELLQYLISCGFQIWQHFKDGDIFNRLRIDEATGSWLRLFFIDWQWPVQYLTQKNDEKSFIDLFWENYDPDALPALQLLFEDIKLPGLDAQQVLEGIISFHEEGKKNRPRPQSRMRRLAWSRSRFPWRKLDHASLYFLAKNGAQAEACQFAIYALFKEFKYQEFFAETIDRLVEAVNGENVEIELPDEEEEGRKFHTTLLHAAASNTRNIFALRYLIEKHGYDFTESRDSRGYTVLEAAAAEDNGEAVHYLLQRAAQQGPVKELADRALVAAVKDNSGRFGCSDLVKLLVEAYHANPRAKDNYGREAISYAEDAALVYLKRCAKSK